MTKTVSNPTVKNLMREAKLDGIATRRGEFRKDNSEQRAHSFHVGTFLMERAMTRKLGFNAFQVALDAENLSSIGRQLNSYATMDCNTGLNERQEARLEKLADQAREIAGWYDLTAHCYGDPRGYVLRVDGPDVVKNGWGDGFGVA